jgi:hypothetical protein|tara:strand:+ start:1069 stop:1242 length:174 start_codon:yes stop_codon:yes gene_type:complete
MPNKKKDQKKKDKDQKKKEHYLIPDQNPPVDSERLNAFNGKPTGQGYGAARLGPDVV